MKNAEIERGEYAAIFFEQAWSIKDLLHGKKITFSCGANAGNPERASRVANQNAGFASSFPLADSAV